ncbi:hypothetical protein BDZ90DRAFT_279417 [Jaminaea rosea]|uniref:UBX domain-containing protein n=1 Tax=Jaminaea rosea TaxID=1569628 RepID=A0A316UQN3_9BASI|nr:hypothetical protein BDZ90DRAFT_279417 [Jaminaea rosea]PWN27629.1 hypothetical protein BDZ90DRAFT_279417 [Jaminaea rosea]
MPDKDDLLAMGFEPARVDWALRSTGNSGLQSALDHLEANEGKPVPDVAQQTTTTPGSGSAGGGGNGPPGEYDEEEQAALMEMLKTKGQGAVDAATGSSSDGAGMEAKSIKCTDCGKVLKNSAFASFHAEKSGHTNFEESTEEVKPLTEEEKKERLAELRRKLAEKRAAQSTVDAQEAKANEQIRRKAGQDMAVAKDEMEKREAEKERKRKAAEKKADAEAKARVREQIEADKRERAERVAREKAARSGQTTQATPAAAAGAAPAPPPQAKAASTANESRLRIRAPGGQWMGTVPAETTLKQVEQMVVDAGNAAGPLKFSQTFPRKFFTDEEKQKTLRELGLVPNAALEAANA